MRNCSTCSKVLPKYASDVVITFHWSVVSCVQGSSVENGIEWLVMKTAGIQLSDLERDQDVWDCVCLVTFELL